MAYLAVKVSLEKSILHLKGIKTEQFVGYLFRKFTFDYVEATLHSRHHDIVRSITNILFQVSTLCVHSSSQKYAVQAFH
jgi:hypothetical protein